MHSHTEMHSQGKRVSSQTPPLPSTAGSLCPALSDPSQGPSDLSCSGSGEDTAQSSKISIDVEKLISPPTVARSAPRTFVGVCIPRSLSLCGAKPQAEHQGPAHRQHTPSKGRPDLDPHGIMMVWLGCSSKFIADTASRLFTEWTREKRSTRADSSGFFRLQIEPRMGRCVKQGRAKQTSLPQDTSPTKQSPGDENKDFCKQGASETGGFNDARGFGSWGKKVKALAAKPEGLGSLHTRG